MSNNSEKVYTTATGKTPTRRRLAVVPPEKVEKAIVKPSTKRREISRRGSGVRQAVSSIKVDKRVWSEAMRRANYDKYRLVVRSATCVIVLNHPRKGNLMEKKP